AYGRHLYIGIAAYKAGTNPAWRNTNEIPHQIRLARQTENVQGAIYFSSTSFNRNPNGWCDSLQNNYYRTPARIPVMGWLPENPNKITMRKQATGSKKGK
ncbi:MAG: hypothetical protein JST09_10355, partial [Bacteroidetes bacterium]|nr:hypothetical protein [Bacteroidota bacterium]